MLTSTAAPRPLALVGPGAPVARETHTLGAGHELLRQASARLRRTVPFDAAGWFATDPATLLPTSPAVIENVETGYCDDYWNRENRGGDVLAFRDLARAPLPSDTLVAATGGNPRRSTRFREYMAPLGYVDELRTALRVGDRTWGVAVLLRSAGRPPFTAREVQRVTDAGPAVAAALAGLATVPRTDVPRTDGSAEGGDGPGTAVFGPSGALGSIDAAAERWFAELAGGGWAGSPMLRSTLSALVTRGDAVADGRDHGPAVVRLRTRDGRWLTMHASRLHTFGDDGGATAVVIGPATSAQIAPILVDAYGLTPREQEVTRAVARGLSNGEIAAALHLSPHTVRDHLKAVFGKLDVGSRGALVARLFDRFSAPMLHSPVEAPHIEW